MVEPQTFLSQSALIEAGNRMVEQVDVVSFDLFDTLVVRRIHNPDLVKLPVARYIAKKAATVNRVWTWNQVQLLRDECERKNRAQSAEQYPDAEAHYPTFMRETLKQVFADHYSEAWLEDVTSFELKTENTMLVPRARLLEWLKSLKSAGKTILVISDMYLPAEHLRVLLQHAGILKYVDEVRSSADSCRAKASGAGYDLIADELGLDRNRWLHVGDNAISDGFRAIEKGLQALVLHDSEESRRKAIVARYYFFSRGRAYWKGRALQQLMAPLEAENVPRSWMYQEGYNFIGPILSVFIQTIAERCLQQGITKIFFLSREGWMFKQLWESIAPTLYPADELPQIEYLYVSRMALAGASCAHQGLTLENANIVFLPPGNKDFRDLCRIFALEIEPLAPFLDQYGITRETVLSPGHVGYSIDERVKFNRLLNDQDFQNEIRQQTADRGEALRRYLADSGFFDHEHVALVDVGWLGTIQRFFFESVAHYDNLPSCHGMLLGATRGIPYKTVPKNRIEGLIYDKHVFDFASSSILFARDLFEEACRAPHATLNGYELDGDTYRLVFREMDDALGQAEQQQDDYFAELQSGVLDAARRFGPAAALLSDPAGGYKPWINYLLVSKLAFARRKEIRKIRHLHHLDDFHGSHKPKKSRRPRFVVNPWEDQGWRGWLGSVFQGRLYRKHLRSMINH
ncbi:MAG: HAD family hydrolase [Pseudomonadota bacterium]